MSFLKPQMANSGFVANSAATGLGHLIGADPSRIGQIARGIGGVANGFASAGGAAPGYVPPDNGLNNHLQMLDPEVLKAIISQFRSAPKTGVYQ